MNTILTSFLKRQRQAIQQVDYLGAGCWLAFHMAVLALVFRIIVSDPRALTAAALDGLIPQWQIIASAFVIAVYALGVCALAGQGASKGGRGGGL
ncbi:hypothetical protein [Sinimarinibacterium sp. NLF-5-8]|uniref:hypothetical protein n=1 Tax=Sinimarinibacterium sp. NLF-5-8 TaxID=2698684 RepID=UPI00137BBB8C|nr:hypothetical protein [Sinimarinibacterium sp. NLF-5-8]QHS09096.1 hypothetical protein GT972_02310 [Sinimarinibacterium sp. NLF-5-8]